MVAGSGVDLQYFTPSTERSRDGASHFSSSALRKMSARIANCDCVVLPSYREGLPRVFLEASLGGSLLSPPTCPAVAMPSSPSMTGILCVHARRLCLPRQCGSAPLSSDERQNVDERSRARAEKDFAKDQVVAAYLTNCQRLADESPRLSLNIGSDYYWLPEQ